MVAHITANPRLLPGRGRRGPPLLALPRRTLRARDQYAALVRAWVVCMNSNAHSDRRVGKGVGNTITRSKAYRTPCPRVVDRNKYARTRGHGAREASICGTTVPTPLPTLPRC